MSLLERIGFGPAKQPEPVIQPAPQVQAPSPAPQPAPAQGAEFANLWENDPNAAPTQPQGINYNIPPEELAKLAANMDFSSSVPAELKQRIANGGDDAIAASLEMQNLIARQVWSHNAMSTAKLIEKAVEKERESFTSIVDQRFKALGLAENTHQLNPALNDPEVKPIVDAIQAQILRKFPNATSQEQATMVNNYLSSVVNKFDPTIKDRLTKAEQKGNINNSQPEYDWSKFLEVS